MSADTKDRTGRDALRRRKLDRRTAMRLAAEEYRLLADSLGELTAADWAQPTDCPEWDVRQVACHCVGMAEMAAGIREGSRQQRIAAAEAASKNIQMVDALTDLQVRERADWTPAQVVDAARAVGRRAARGRRMTPFFIRRRRMPAVQIVNGEPESWSIGFVVDTILTRDPWMHRIDLARATGRPLVLTAEHDGVIVADAVAEWAERHGQAYRLTLTGPAGGSWSSGTDGPVIHMDAIEFCRVISGRGPGQGLLATEVPF